MIEEKALRVIAKIINAAQTGQGCEITGEEAKIFIDSAPKFHQVQNDIETENSNYFPSTIGGDEEIQSSTMRMNFTEYVSAKTLPELSEKLADFNSEKLNGEILEALPLGAVQHFPEHGFVQTVLIIRELQRLTRVNVDVRPREHCVEVQYFLNAAGWRDEELTELVQEFDGVRGDSDCEMPNRLRTIEFYFLTLEDSEAAHTKLEKLEGLEKVSLKPREIPGNY
jgi:hypothetical protein